MKKLLTISLVLVLMLSFVSCSGGKAVFSSPADITAEKLVEITTPKNIVAETGVFSVTTTYANTGDATYDKAVTVNICENRDGIYHFNDITTYGGMTQIGYYNTNPDDGLYYIAFQNQYLSEELYEGETDAILNGSVLGYSADDITLLSAEDNKGEYILTVSVADLENHTVTVDPKSGLVTKVIATSCEANEDGTYASMTLVFDYSKGQTVDDSPKSGQESQGE